MGDYKDKTLLAVLYAVQNDFPIKELSRVYRNKIQNLLEGGYKIQFNEPISSAECCIVLYIDGNYYADTMNVVKEYSKTRISSNDTQIQHRPNTDLTKKTSLGRAVDKVVEKEKVEDE